jgi:phosphohistidine phosphatase
MPRSRRRLQRVLQSAGAIGLAGPDVAPAERLPDSQLPCPAGQGVLIQAGGEVVGERGETGIAGRSLRRAPVLYSDPAERFRPGLRRRWPGSPPGHERTQARDTVTMAARTQRTLVLLRHAKSAWPDVPDHERPLAPRGLRDAPVAGRWLREAVCVPDHVICSTARRACQTWQLAEAALGQLPPVMFESSVYAASAAGLLDLIHHAPSAARTVLVVGHDPALQDLALDLAGVTPGADHGAMEDALSADALDRMRAKFPTAAIAVLDFTGPWPRLGAGRAWLASFVTPRELRARQQSGAG